MLGHLAPDPLHRERDVKRKTLTEELSELERTDPAVKRAADNYDMTVRRILRKRTPTRSET